MRVPCIIETVEMENDQGYEIEGVVVTCSRCEHYEESFGTSDASVRRCFALMRENCPQEETNFYVPEGEYD